MDFPRKFQSLCHLVILAASQKFTKWKITIDIWHPYIYRNFYFVQMCANKFSKIHKKDITENENDCQKVYLGQISETRFKFRIDKVLVKMNHRWVLLNIREKDTLKYRLIHCSWGRLTFTKTPLNFAIMQFPASSYHI